MGKLKKNFDILLASLIMLLFIIYTIIIKIVNVGAVGPLGSKVGMSTINNAVHNFLGVHMWLYNLTDWLGLVPIAIIFAFAVFGLVLWIKRKSLIKVDKEILALGIFYILVACAYLFFEFVVVNYRPVLIEGYLEASYPSSTTMLVMTVCLSSIVALKKYFKNKNLFLTVKIVLIAFTIFMIVGRLISGVHWLTDIIGGIILSCSLLNMYLFLNRVLIFKSK